MSMNGLPLPADGETVEGWHMRRPKHDPKPSHSSALQLVLVFAFYRKPRLYPVRLAFSVISHVRIAHRRQFTGGVLRCMSGGAAAVDDDRRILVGQ